MGGYSRLAFAFALGSLLLWGGILWKAGHDVRLAETDFRYAAARYDDARLRDFRDPVFSEADFREGLDGAASRMWGARGTFRTLALTALAAVLIPPAFLAVGLWVVGGFLRPRQ